LLERLGPALNEVEAALDGMDGFRNRPAGTLRRNVPVSAARLFLYYPGRRLLPSPLRAFVDFIKSAAARGER